MPERTENGVTVWWPHWGFDPAKGAPPEEANPLELEIERLRGELEKKLLSAPDPAPAEPAPNKDRANDPVYVNLVGAQATIIELRREIQLLQGEVASLKYGSVPMQPQPSDLVQTAAVRVEAPANLKRYRSRSTGSVFGVIAQGKFGDNGVMAGLGMVVLVPEDGGAVTVRSLDAFQANYEGIPEDPA